MDIIVLILFGWGTSYGKHVRLEHEQGYLYQVTSHVEQAAQLAIAVYIASVTGKENT